MSESSEHPKKFSKSNLKTVTGQIAHLIRKSLGRQTVVFLMFLLISAVLWLIMSLNENLQRNLNCEIKFANVPDSVTFISRIPHSINISVSGRGTDLVKYQFGSKPVLEIDFKKFRHGNYVELSESDISNQLQKMLGSDVRIQRMDLDSMNILFTTLPGKTVPVKINANIKTALTARQIGQPQVTPSEVKIYGISRESLNVQSVSTEALDLKDVKESFIRRVRVITAPGVRAIPDSVDVKVVVEPMLYRSEEVTIETINAPGHIKIIPNPPTVRVDYLVPASSPDEKPDLRVVADFNSLNSSLSSDKIKILLLNPDDNVFLTTDSVFYLAEILQTVNETEKP